MAANSSKQSRRAEAFEPPTQVEIETLVGFLPHLNDPECAQTERQTESGGDVFSLGILTYSEDAYRLLEFLSGSRFVQRQFAWPDWQEKAERYVVEPERLRTASMDDLQRLLTTHVRKERFCEGHFAAMLECGHIAAIVERVAELMKTSPSSELES